MDPIEEIYIEYIRMRENGVEAQAVLRALKPYIEPLPNQAKEELARHLRTWENSYAQSNSAPPVTHRPQAIPPAHSVPPAQPVPSTKTGIKPIRQLLAAESPDVAWLSCANCGKKNRSTEVFCFACGHMLDTQGQFDTRKFADAQRFTDSYFGPESVLILSDRVTKSSFQLRPQVINHELVIGRSTANSAMMPDVDLADCNGERLGVSRLHMAIKLHPEDSALQVYDLGSANGSYINGQKLHPKEVRMLRNGDEIRLGRLVMRVTFHHPGEEIQ